MAKRLQLRRGITTENNAFTGAVGELTYDTEKKQLRVHDGSTVGGRVVDDQFRNVTSQVSNATETVAGKAEIATQIETNAATDDTLFVTPKKLLEGLRNHLNVTGIAPMFACRAWVNFNGTGTVAIRASGNVSSITDNGVGDYTINLTTALGDGTFSVGGNAKRIDNSVFGSGNESTTFSCYGKTSSLFKIRTGTTTSVQDCEIIDLQVFR